jgi:type III restriction enzyme
MPFQITEQNAAALEPLFKPWAEPNRHRLPNPKQGAPALVQPGRRPSKAPLVRSIRAQVDDWRRSGYPGVSQTSRTLLDFWFNGEHLKQEDDGSILIFRYHWAQREAIETIIYLYELRGIQNVASLLTEFGEGKLDDIADGIPPDQDRFAEYCCKIATGGGKTQVMALAMVWSYFHSLYEPNSNLARHFVVIAPNLTVYERLKEDFENATIFHDSAHIPDEWKNDFQVQVVLQDEPGGTSSQGAVYLTNIHRLYEKNDSAAVMLRDEASPHAGEILRSAQNDKRSTVMLRDQASIFGPEVKRGKALDTSAALRERIASHPRLMVLNDEAHHLHDPDLAWNRAIDTLHELNLQKGGAGICAQLDFTATPKHNNGDLFRHIICDFPLGEAVDAGIVKVPVLGESDQLIDRGGKNTPAHERYNMHLKLGYARYEETFKNFEKVRKPILFVMTEDADAANEIADYLDTDAFPLLKGRVLNIHTRLKGKIKKVMRGGREIQEFVESETGMKPDDLRALREMSRDLDSPNSHFRCVVSVMMLREGWDVRNVTTIVPLRAYSAKAGILPEQTLGRGLRRMFPAGDIPETVTVVHHPAFRKLYEEELAQEGLEIGVIPIERALKETVTIFVDREHKPVDELELEIPLVSDSIETTAELKDLTLDEIEKYFHAHFQPLPIGKKKDGPIEYKERHLFTDEIVARMQLDAGLLNAAWSAPSYFSKMLATACHLTNAHAALTPLVEQFISKILFEHPVDVFSGEVDHRMRDLDVTEYIRATFTPLMLAKTIIQKERVRVSAGQKISAWKAFQATSTEKRPAVPAQRTMFNLVPCENDFEQAFADFLDYAEDVAAFAKNAGPQKLALDYLRPDGHRALYAPDFIIRLTSGHYVLAELKGRQDPNVPVKASAAVEWCKTASNVIASAASSSRTKQSPSSKKEIASAQKARLAMTGEQWQYLYVPYMLFQQSSAGTCQEMIRACQPALQELLNEFKTGQIALPLEEASARQQADDFFTQLLRDAGMTTAPEPVADTFRQAAESLDHDIRAGYKSLGGGFQPLLEPLDRYALQIIASRLKSKIPADEQKRQAYFSPFLGALRGNEQRSLEKFQRYLRDNLVYARSNQKLATLLFCLEYANKLRWGAEGVWRDVAKLFAGNAFAALYADLEQVNTFRNTYIAHVETSALQDAEQARAAMMIWLRCIHRMIELTSGS